MAASAIAASSYRQLLGYVAVFVLFSSIGLANRLHAALSGAEAETPSWLLVLQAWTMPLQGVANAAVFSRWLRTNWQLRASAASLIARSCSRGRVRHRLPPECAAGVARTDLEAFATSPAKAMPAVAAGVAAGVAQAVTAAPATGLEGIGSDPWPTARLFAATWNVGEASPPTAAELAAWMPAGRDAYFIGLQECLAPAAWQRALADALALHGGGGGGGGGEAYELLTERKIGSTQTKLGYHGYIVLFAFARRRLRETGALSAATTCYTGLQPRCMHRPTACSTCGHSLQHVGPQPAAHAVAGALSAVISGGAKVRRGTQVGLARASNKGAVGAAFRMHQHTVAVVSAHLAADKKGRVHLERRLRDVCEVLPSDTQM